MYYNLNQTAYVELRDIFRGVQRNVLDLLHFYQKWKIQDTWEDKGKQRLVRKAQTCSGVMFVKYLL